MPSNSRRQRLTDRVHAGQATQWGWTPRSLTMASARPNQIQSLGQGLEQPSLRRGKGNEET
jgi:hypothetical protein